MTDLTVSKPQELSIQWLSFSRVQKYTQIPKEEMITTPLSDLVRRIMELYNKRREENGNQSRRFDYLDEFEFEGTHDYQLVAYERVGKIATVLARELEAGGVSQQKLPKKTSTDFLFFFFRQIPRREIIAVSSGAAWEVIRPCVNYKVPIAIAGRILEPNKISEIARRCLLGNDVKEIIHNPNGRELCKISNIYYLVEHFQCKVKEDSSMTGLAFFKETPPEIKISAGLLRVRKRMALTDYPPLLALFSEHIDAHRRPKETSTYNSKGEVEGFDKDFEFLHFLTPVPSSKDALDRRAVNQIFHAYQKSRRQELSIRHKFLEEFLNSDNYEIQLTKGARFRSLSCRPESIEQLIELLNESALISEATMHKAFKEAVLRYQRKDGTQVASHLIEFVEGEVRDAEGNSYFKIRGVWYKLAVDFQALLHEDYRRLLRQALIKPGEEGQLPKTWRGNKHQGELLEPAVKEKLGISKGIRAFMKALKEAEGCFVDKEGNVNQSKLVGEILKNEVIRKHQDAINKELLSKNKLPSSKEERIALFGADAVAVVKELKKERPVIQKDSKYVVNPFHYLFKSEPLLKGKYKEFAAYLQELHEIYALGVEDEGAYNQAYLEDPYGPENRYLVFDKICPHGIEPCDVVYFTEETVYLYHIKETLGQHTRDACSQILNAAKQFRSALSTHHADNFIELMWKKAEQQLESVGEEAFYSIFRDKRVVFVYAFLDHGQRSIYDEARTKSCLSPADLDLSKNPETYQRLKELQFLDNSGRLTGKFCASTQERFLKADRKLFSEELYKKMSGYSPVSKSTLAKIELLDTAREVRALGFEFKICQIKRPEGDNPSENKPSDSFETDLFSLDEISDTPYEQPRAIDDKPDIIEDGPVGLYNLGNSCYINAVLQALFNTLDIRDTIDKVDNAATLFMRALQQLLQNEDPPTEKALENFRTLLFRENNLPGGKTAQQDAHEFLTFVLDKLNWRPLTLFNRYEVDQRFHDSPTENRTHHLSVSIDGIKSFQEALDNFFAAEDMKADEKVDPLELEELLVDEWQQTQCIKAPLPNDLIVHLMRFRNDRSKITKPLSYPPDGRITIEDESGTPTTYEITAFINHHGETSQSGHYTADVKNFRGAQGVEEWVHCDDRRLKEMAPLNPERDAYIVFLQKIDIDE